MPVIYTNSSQNSTEQIFGYLGGIITYIGDSLSIIGCTLFLVTFSLFKDLRTFPAKIVVNIAVVILVTNVLVILSVNGAAKKSGPLLCLFTFSPLLNFHLVC